MTRYGFNAIIIKYMPAYERAAWLTLRIGVAGIVAAIVLGLICATVQYYRVPVDTIQSESAYSLVVEGGEVRAQ